jgi:hypothetical protein
VKLLFEASAPVRAPLATVRGLIDDGWALDAFLGGDPTARSYVDVDHRDGVVGFQGHWWYRGEISASESEGQTVLTYRVFNIAKKGAWAVPLANRMFIGYGRQVRESVTGLARAVETRLA